MATTVPGSARTGGLRISAKGLARIGVMLLRNGDGFLKPQGLARMEKMHPVKSTGGGIAYFVKAVSDDRARSSVPLVSPVAAH